MKLYISLIAVALLFSKCRECAQETENLGEQVAIPVHFDGYSLEEINGFDVYRIERTTLKRDTFKLTQLLKSYTAYNNTTQLTDRAYKSSYGHYDSYLNNSDLVLVWRYGTDTLSNIMISKSKVDADKCHKDDPNVRIDHLSFEYHGKTIGKNELITISKN